MIKRYLPIFLGFFLFLLATVTPSQASAAPRLYFDPSAPTVTKDTEFEVKVQIDVETQSAFGADATVIYTPADLTLVSVTSGGFFTDFAQAQTSGRVELHGYLSAVFDSKSGSGTLATLKFSSPKNSGSSSLTFTCTGSGNDTQILDSNGNNILNCGSLNQGNITFSSSSQTTTDNQTSPSPTPNSCAGTCGSNYDCKAGLYCYQGFCRNPACSVDIDCICNVPKTPATPKPTAKPKPTPQTVALAPYVSPTPEPEVTPVPEQLEEVKGPIGVEVIAIIVILAALGVGVLWLLKKMKERGKPPYINMAEGSEGESPSESQTQPPPAPPTPPTNS